MRFIRVTVIDQWPGQKSRIVLTSSSTVRLLESDGPKLKDSQGAYSWVKTSAKRKYPESGSSTCCHGLVAGYGHELTHHALKNE